MVSPLTFVYLHGFASSPLAHKAAFLRPRLEELGARLLVPDLNQPSFEGLTLTAQAEVVVALLDELTASSDPPVVIGSSMGALVALMASRQRPGAVRRMLLIAPALKFVGAPLARALGSSLEAWERHGSLPVLHPEEGGRIYRVGFDLVRDARGYDFDALVPSVPTMIVHGTADELVPFEASQVFCREHAEIRLIPIAGGDHGLSDHMETIWERTKRFLLEG